MLVGETLPQKKGERRAPSWGDLADMQRKLHCNGGAYHAAVPLEFSLNFFLADHTAPCATSTLSPACITLESGRASSGINVKP